MRRPRSTWLPVGVIAAWLGSSSGSAGGALVNALSAVHTRPPTHPAHPPPRRPRAREWTPKKTPFCTPAAPGPCVTRAARRRARRARVQHRLTCTYDRYILLIARGGAQTPFPPTKVAVQNDPRTHENAKLQKTIFFRLFRFFSVVFLGVLCLLTSHPPLVCFSIMIGLN